MNKIGYNHSFSYHKTYLRDYKTLKKEYAKRNKKNTSNIDIYNQRVSFRKKYSKMNF